MSSVQPNTGGARVCSNIPQTEVKVSKFGHRTVKCSFAPDPAKSYTVNQLVDHLLQQVNSGSGPSIKQLAQNFTQIKNLHESKVTDRATLVTYLHAARSYFGSLFSHRSEKLDQIDKKLDQMAHEKQNTYNNLVQNFTTRAQVEKNLVKTQLLESGNLLKDLEANTKFLEQSPQTIDDIDALLNLATNQKTNAEKIVKEADALVKQAEKNIQDLNKQLIDARYQQYEAQDTVGARGDQYSTIGKSIEEIKQHLQEAANDLETTKENRDKIKGIANAVLTKLEEIRSQKEINVQTEKTASEVLQKNTIDSLMQTSEKLLGSSRGILKFVESKPVLTNFFSQAERKILQAHANAAKGETHVEEAADKLKCLIELKEKTVSIESKSEEFSSVPNVLANLDENIQDTQQALEQLKLNAEIAKLIAIQSEDKLDERAQVEQQQFNQKAKKAHEVVTSIVLNRENQSSTSNQHSQAAKDALSKTKECLSEINSKKNLWDITRLEEKAKAAREASEAASSRAKAAEELAGSASTHLESLKEQLKVTKQAQADAEALIGKRGKQFSIIPSFIEEIENEITKFEAFVNIAKTNADTAKNAATEAIGYANSCDQLIGIIISDRENAAYQIKLNHACEALVKKYDELRDNEDKKTFDINILDKFISFKVTGDNTIGIDSNTYQYDTTEDQKKFLREMSNILRDRYRFTLEQT